jgi:agmatinase
MQGPAAAPPLIRSALHSPSSNLTSETGVSFDDHPLFKDIGDWEIGEDRDAFLKIADDVQALAEQGGLPLILGGDHAITYPVVQGLARKHQPLSLLHFDAHSDVYQEMEGNPLSHASPFARIMEEGLVKRLVQVGIRTLNTHQREQIERFGVEVHEMRFFEYRSFQPEFNEPIYVSFDMDALDPGCAPGVSHFEPGGLTVREALSIIHRIKAPILGADIVEYNPQRDHHTLTAMVAAKLVKEIGAMMLLNASWAIRHDPITI